MPPSVPLAAAQNSAPQVPPGTPLALVPQAMAFVALGAESSVRVTVSRSPLRLELAPRRSIPAHGVLAIPLPSKVSPATSETEWSRIGQLDWRLILWFLK